MNNSLMLTQEQLQKLSVNQIQSLQILSLSAKSLHELLKKETEENPFVEYSPTSANSPSTNDPESFLNFIAAPEQKSVKQFILEQLNYSSFTKSEWALLSYLAEYVDTRGYLTISEKELTEKIPLPPNLFNSCLKHLQGLDPAGIGATNLKECLKLQLQRVNKLSILLSTLIDNHLTDIRTKNLSHICSVLKEPKSKIIAAINIIKHLNPAPLQNFFDHEISYIVPDVIINLTNEGYKIILNDTWISSYSMSDYYIRMMKSTTDESVKKYFEKKYTRCRLLFYNIERRRQTLYTLTEAIWSCQKSYLQKQGPLKPMTLSDIALKVGVHPSTISRSIKNKYLQTPYMTVSFKNLFQRPFPKTGKNISKDAVKQALIQLIQTEPPTTPYSDAELTQLLSVQFKRTFSRRLIQKYRISLHIDNSYTRKSILT